MKTQADKTSEEQTMPPKYKNTASSTGGSAKFVDSRSGAIAQRKLHEGLADRSHHQETVQLQKGMLDGTVKQEAPLQRKSNQTGLPDNLKTGAENLSGYSLDDVKVHYNSSKPAQLQAHAYAQGTDIHLAPGQEAHLPHEAWHVVQQKQGRVKPTRQLKSKVNINDDAGLEKEADVMGAKALQQTNVKAIQRKELQPADPYGSENSSGKGANIQGNTAPIQRQYLKSTDPNSKSAQELIDNFILQGIIQADPSSPRHARLLELIRDPEKKYNEESITEPLWEIDEEIKEDAATSEQLKNFQENGQATVIMTGALMTRAWVQIFKGHLPTDGVHRDNETLGTYLFNQADGNHDFVPFNARDIWQHLDQEAEFIRHLAKVESKLNEIGIPAHVYCPDLFLDDKVGEAVPSYWTPLNQEPEKQFEDHWQSTAYNLLVMVGHGGPGGGTDMGAINKGPTHAGNVKELFGIKDASSFFYVPLQCFPQLAVRQAEKAEFGGSASVDSEKKIGGSDITHWVEGSMPAVLDGWFRHLLKS